MIDLSITIVSTNNLEQLCNCLASIYDSSPNQLGLDVTVVDNASTVDWSVVRTRFPSVQILRTQERLGYAAAHNLALPSIQGRHLLIMNDDMVVQPEALLHVVRYLDEHPKVGALGCKLINTDGSLQISSFLSYPTLASQLREALLLHLVLQRLPSVSMRFTMYGRANTNDRAVRSVRHLMGAFIAVRRAVLADAGPLDPQYFLSFEDVDWCWRIRRAGWDIVYLPDAVVLHYGSQTLGKQQDRFLSAFYAGRLRFEGKHGGKQAERALRAVILLELSCKTLLHSTMARIIKDAPGAEARARQSNLATAYRIALLNQVRGVQRGRVKPA